MKTIVLDNAFFSNALAGLDTLRLMFEAKVTKTADADYTPVVISNYTKQSIGNRGVSTYITCQVTYGKGESAKTFTVELSPGWRPARDNSKVGLTEFKGASVMTSHANGGDYWQILKNRSFKTPHLESTAMLTYLVDQLATAGVLSGESAFKVAMLKHLITTLQVSAMKITMRDKKNQPIAYEPDLGNVQAFLKWAEFRLASVRAVPDAKQAEKSKSNRLVKVNSDEPIPAEFEL